MNGDEILVAENLSEGKGGEETESRRGESEIFHSMKSEPFIWNLFCFRVIQNVRLMFTVFHCLIA